jgi:LysR family nitrogen assimilation transcriptional regulator
MNLKLLKVFLTIANAGSFSRAAAVLSVAQPILSRQIRTLEEELGTQLLYRNGRGITLTQAGMVFQKHAQTIVDTMAEATGELSQLHETPTGEVILGLPPTVGGVLTVPLVKRFKQAFPNVSLAVVEGFSGFVLEWLANGRLDVAVLYNTPHTKFMSVDTLLDEQLVLVGRADSDFATDRTMVTGEDIKALPLILPTRMHGLRILVEAAFSGAHISPTIAVELDSLHSTIDLVKKGVGYTILSYAAIYEHVKAGELRYWTLTRPTISRTLVLATSTSRAVTPVSRALATMVRQHIKELAATGQWSPT